MPCSGNSNRKNKILYIFEHCEEFNPALVDIEVNGQKVDRLTTSFSNPFSNHINSKIKNLFFGTTIPAGLINPGD